ncbi:MAG: hypothetical protein K1X66_02355 [Verrucomicrobiae bacterium]|nr:hypothetical protein [Verrucomicrobiae bacterium]
MTITQFKKVVSGYMLRQKESFIYDEEDVLLFAINNAKLFAQRTHNFEMAVTTIRVVMTPSGIDLNAAPIAWTAPNFYKNSKVKTVKRAYLKCGASVVKDPCSCKSDPFYPIEVISKAALINKLRRMDNLSPIYWDEKCDYSRTLPNCPTLICQASHAFLYPQPTHEVDLVLDIVQWLPDYNEVAQENEECNTDAHATDFFLEYCKDFMLFRSISELNFFIKDDERVAISQKKLDEAWQSVIKWDGELVDGASYDLEGD